MRSQAGGEGAVSAAAVWAMGGEWGIEAAGGCGRRAGAIGGPIAGCLRKESVPNGNQKELEAIRRIWRQSEGFGGNQKESEETAIGRPSEAVSGHRRRQAGGVRW